MCGRGRGACVGWVGGRLVDEYVGLGAFQAEEPDSTVETQDILEGCQMWLERDSSGKERRRVGFSNSHGCKEHPWRADGYQTRSPSLLPSPPESSHSSGAVQLSSGIRGERALGQCGCWGTLCSLPPPFPLLRAPSAMSAWMRQRVWPWELL